MALKSVTLKCETCGKNYDTEQEANDCNIKDNQCHCLNNNAKRINSKTIAYGKALISYVDFEKKQIVVHINNDGSETFWGALPISFCPLCGRQL